MKKVLMLLAMIILLVGCSEKTVDIDGAVLDYEELQAEISKSEQELIDIESELETVKAELKEEQSKLDDIDELKEIAENRDRLAEEISASESELAVLNADIERAENGLEKARGELLKVKDEPIKLNPGYYYFGIDDIEPGRYKITAQEGQRGNVFIRDERGSYVSDTFGTGDDGHTIAEFTFHSSEGDEIEATIPVYLYPVE